jgi:SAM-dependent methyltransferase
MLHKPPLTILVDMTETFQIPLEAAEVYEERFVPALFGQWAPLLIEEAGVDRGHRVLDVACGTGIVARTAADRVGPTGSVVGLDLNEAMLIVAKRVRPDLEWRQGDAAELPFEDGSFDVALCQMALMFFPDRAGALAEMARVVTADGVVAICVPAGLDDQPAYGPLDHAVGELAGPEAQSLMTTYWSCGDLAYLRKLFAQAGLTVTSARSHVGTVKYPSVDDAVTTELEATPLGELISKEAYEALRKRARELLQRYVADDRSVGIPLAGHLVVARR